MARIRPGAGLRAPLAIILLSATLFSGTLATPAGTLAAQPAAACLLPAGGTVGEIDFEWYPQPIGLVRALMIFVDFPDAPAMSSTEAARTLMFPGAADWYATASYGRMTFDVTVAPDWFRMPLASTAYGMSRDGIETGLTDYLAAAVAVADPTVDFSGYDLYYVVSNPEATAITTSAAFQDGEESPIRADGATIGFAADLAVDFWQGVSEAGEAGHATLVHETGHLFGLPDLYVEVADDILTYVGGWDIMGDTAGLAPDFTAWSKWLLGWLDDGQVTCLNAPGQYDVTLTPLATVGGRKLLAMRTGPTTVIAAEYRTAVGLDAKACVDGVLIYKLFNNVQSASGPVRIQDATPGEPSDSCQHPRDDGAWWPTDGSYTDTASGVTLTVLSMSATAAKVRVKRTSAFPADVRHARRTSLSARRSSGVVTATAQLTVPDGHAACRSGRSMSLQEFRSGKWVTIRTSNTNSSGRWTYTWRGRAGKYRIVASQVILGTTLPRHVCLAATSPTITIR